MPTKTVSSQSTPEITCHDTSSNTLLSQPTPPPTTDQVRYNVTAYAFIETQKYSSLKLIKAHFTHYIFLSQPTSPPTGSPTTPLPTKEPTTKVSRDEMDLILFHVQLRLIYHLPQPTNSPTNSPSASPSRVSDNLLHAASLTSPKR